MAVDAGQVQPQTTVQAEPPMAMVTGAPPAQATSTTIATAHGTIISAAPFDDPGAVLQRALGQLPPVPAWIWLLAPYVLTLLAVAVGYLTVEAVQYHSDLAGKALAGIGVFIAGWFAPSPASAFARKL